MNPVYWLTAGMDEVPEGDGWLGPRERAALSELRFPARIRDWRLGRWTAKRTLSRLVGSPEGRCVLRELEVCAAEDGAPEPFCGGSRLPVSLSMSHRDGVALCAVSGAGVRVGCDLEMVEPRSRAFVADYFTLAEREFAGEDAVRIALVWSAKESALKLLREGLRRDTRSAEVALAEVPQRAWRELTVRCDGEPAAFRGWARRAGPFVLTIAADPVPAWPVPVAPAVPGAVRRPETTVRCGAARPS